MPLNAYIASGCAIGGSSRFVNGGSEGGGPADPVAATQAGLVLSGDGLDPVIEAGNVQPLAVRSPGSKPPENLQPGDPNAGSRSQS